jgi:hypothetical protein
MNFKQQIAVFFAMLFCICSYSQAQVNAKVVTGSQTISKKDNNANKYDIIVGQPYLANQIQTTSGTITSPSNNNIRFPWSVLYLQKTFAEANFEVSKGYFPDKVLISWLLNANQNNIDNFEVYRRPKLALSDTDNAYQKIATLPSTAIDYEDRYIEGGVLYEYRIVAVGISLIQEKYLTFIDGLGFRTPAATVTGSVNYVGNSPVKDVVVLCEPTNNSSINPNSSVKINQNSWLTIANTNKVIDADAMFQAWIKPVETFMDNQTINLMSLKSSSNNELHTITLTKKNENNEDYLSFNLAGHVYDIYNLYPSGGIDTRGNDELNEINEINNEYIHIAAGLSVNGESELFINGRKIDVNYVNEINEALSELPTASGNPELTPLRIEIDNSASTFNTANALDIFEIGGSNTKAFYTDELRFWNTIQSAEAIRNDYRRYITGNDPSLVFYFRLNEKVDDRAYDLSHEGFNYNGNIAAFNNVAFDATQKAEWVTEAENNLREDQLGFFGVTDQNGNYIINGIPYSGTGESFDITPTLGIHQFSPNQQLVFLGADNPVAQDIDFTDESSFSFKGQVFYDTRGVFDKIEGDDTVLPGNWEETGYNYYQNNGEGVRRAKGNYWVNDSGKLEEFPKIYLGGANVFIDNQMVLDQNNTPVETDSNGEFDIQVPIGRHYITVKKQGHELTYNGRYPAIPDGDYEGNDLTVEFFEDRNQPVYFLDTTRVSMVGRVVGGAIEAAKPIGFGIDGVFEQEITTADGLTETTTISSINNIGQAEIVLGFDAGTGITNDTRMIIKTNPDTGEYSSSLLPLQYTIEADKNQTPLINNESLSFFGTEDETLNLREIVEATTPSFELPSGEDLTGTPFQYEKSFIYRSEAILSVLEQQSEIEIELAGDATDIISTAGFTAENGDSLKVYKQFNYYDIKLSRHETYVNYDAEPVETQVPVTDGEVVITNNLSLDQENDTTVVDENDLSLITYTFRAGVPAVALPYEKTIDIQLQIDGDTKQPDNLVTNGLILGGASDGSQTFVTAGVDSPDIILRDPPGSNSFATIESGQSISITKEIENKFIAGSSLNVKVLTGLKVQAGGGLAGPVISTEVINTIDTGISLSASSNTAESSTQTYTFNQSISTSADPYYVGSEGDLYIGVSKNYAYGTYNDFVAKRDNSGDGVPLELSNSAGETVYINRKKAMYINEEPTGTFFIYSQKQILESLIPDLEFIVESFEDGSNEPTDSLGVDYYNDQILKWKSVVRENERVKYELINDKEAYKTRILDSIGAFQNDILVALGNGGLESNEELVLNDNLETSNEIRQNLDTEFYNNISFDSGVGSFTRSVETSVVNSSSGGFDISSSIDLEGVLGTTAQDQSLGIIVTTKGFASNDYTDTISEEETTTTTISYTLADNDLNNLLSVDVINSFDGNGPVFSTVAGRTSCPYEGEERTVFYNDSTYDPAAELIEVLPENQQEILSNATQSVEVPDIMVEVASLSNIPESGNAEFLITLTNLSVSESASNFLLYVNPTSNPNNAIINIPADGISFSNFPFGEPTEFALTLGKSISDVYDYEDIEIVFASACDSRLYESVTISANFVPSCTEITLAAPIDNWLFNKEQAFNTDGTSNKMPIKVNGFDLNYNGFEKIDLQYRSVSSSSWTSLKRYYSTQEFYDDAILNGEDNIELLNSNNPEINYLWDIVDQNLQDGDYEVRAVSTCTNDTQFITIVSQGKVDLSAPVVFGTPSPTNGVLRYGEDIKIRFNEPISYNSAISKIEITGATNQLPINNQVSLRFSGQDNTAVISTPYIKTGDFALEFWMNNNTQSANANIITQAQGVNIRLENGELVFEFGQAIARGFIANDDLFHHYSFSYDAATGALVIYEDDSVVDSASAPIDMVYDFANAITIGGNTFVGNIHDLRLWSKSLSLSDAYANIYNQFQGNEPNLTGYWPMNEGIGAVANDLSRFKSAQVNNANWDIKPKGESYSFISNQHLSCDSSTIQLNEQMDFTLSFWVKTPQNQEATIFSNGRGDGTDIQLNDGSSNKWAVNLNSDGNLSLVSEGNTFPLTTTAVTDDSWHHVSIHMNRLGNLNTYVDAALVSSQDASTIKGFFGNKIWVGARGHIDLSNTETVDREFTGLLDEVRLWNSLRSFEQIDRDRYNEVNTSSTGLVFYMKMKSPESASSNGPRYFYRASDLSVTSQTASISSGMPNYSIESPAIKPARDIVNFLVNYTINGDEMILEPVVTDWASLENQILDITVSRMFDGANNAQESPITWTAFVDRNQVNWSIDGEQNLLTETISFGDEKTFEILVRNDGGTNQTFAINNLPSWLSLSQTSGTISPNSSLTITASTDAELASGYYENDLYLVTELGFDQKIQLQLNVISGGPEWEIDPSAFDYSLNMIGRIQIDGVIAQNQYDNIAAFVDGELRGVAKLQYDSDYQNYYAYLTVYSNVASGEVVTFNIWDASSDQTYVSTVNGDASLVFINNAVLGSKANPQVFENTNQIQQVVDLNDGWSWRSFYVESNNFDDINALTSNLQLTESDRMLSHTPSLLEVYGNGAWAGTMSADGGLTTARMYKVNLAIAQTLSLIGEKVNLDTWSFQIKQNWNWLPYVLSKNVLLNQAMANFDAEDGDVIKSQSKFSIYDPINGWSGTLTYLEAGEGYMLRSSSDQDFSYPSNLDNSSQRVSSPLSDNLLDSNLFDKYKKFSFNMNAVVQLPDNYSKLYVYDKQNIVRGEAIKQIVDNKELCFITIYGNINNDELHFYLNDGSTTDSTSKSISFKANEVLGTVKNPIVFSEININGSYDIATYELYPNPFDEKLSLFFTADFEQELNVSVYATTGQIIWSKTLIANQGNNEFDLTFEGDSGVYYVHIKTGEDTIIKKVIKN